MFVGFLMDLDILQSFWISFSCRALVKYLKTPSLYSIGCIITLQTVDEFRKRLNTVLREKYEGVAQNIMPEGYLEAPLAYDAIWAVALALNRTMARLVSNGKNINFRDRLPKNRDFFDNDSLFSKFSYSTETHDTYV